MPVDPWQELVTDIRAGMRPEPTVRDLAEWEAAVARLGRENITITPGPTPVVGLDPAGPGVAVVYRLEVPESFEDNHVRFIYSTEPQAQEASTWGMTIEIEPDLEDWDAALGRAIETMRRSVQPALREMTESSRQAGLAMHAFARSLLPEDGADPAGFLFRSPLGAAEDPNEWTTPMSDQMHWTAPQTDEEVPRWLA